MSDGRTKKMKIHPNGRYKDDARDRAFVIEGEIAKLYDWLFWHGYSAVEAEQLLYSSLSMAVCTERLCRESDQKRIDLSK